LQARNIFVHADKRLLRYLHGQVVVEEEFVGEVVNPFVPQLHQFALGILVPFTGPCNEGIGMHHSNIQ
jgi:hypothetical protein